MSQALRRTAVNLVQRKGSTVTMRSVVAVGEQGSTDRETFSEARGLAQPPSRFRVQDFVAGAWHTLAVCGELDLASRPEFAEAVERIDTTALEGIALDLSAVTFLDSTGIHAVVALHERCQERDVALRIVPGPSRVQRVFSLCGLIDSLPFISA